MASEVGLQSGPGGLSPMVRPGAMAAPFDSSAGYAPVSRSAGYSHQEILRAQTMAALVVGVWGIMFFGPGAASVLTVALVSAIASDSIIGMVIRRPVVGGLWHASVTGLLLGLTLPATAHWYIPMTGSVVAICAKTIFGGMGHYICHPALVGRVFVQVFFNSALTLSGPVVPEAVLTRWHVFVGNLSDAKTIPLASYEGWSEVHRSFGAQAIQLDRPVRRLRDFADGDIKPDKPDGSLRYTPLMRDYLPPWEDTVLGAVPGGIGETSTLALVVAGLYLVYRGYLRWQLPVSILLGAFCAAAIFPIQGGEPGGHFHWLPILAAENGKPTGLAYVLYHLTSGQLMLGAFLLAGDMTVSPKRARGQIFFGAAIGVLTIFMRLYGLLDGECYWSILILNFFVPFIDRRMTRPILGIDE